MGEVTPITLVCWNIEHKSDPWRILRGMEADVALLQETRPPPADAGSATLDVNDPGDWPKGRLNGWAVIVRLSDRVEVEFIEKSFATDPSVLAATRIQPPNAEAFVAVSTGPAFEYPHKAVPGKMGNVDSSLHRSISDLTAFIGRPKHHRVIVAGDLTVMRGPSPYHDDYWSARARTVFARMDALGLQCVGPEAPPGYRRILGPTGCRGQARICRPFAGSAHRRRTRRPNSTMSSCRRGWSTPWECAP